MQLLARICAVALLVAACGSAAPSAVPTDLPGATPADTSAAASPAGSPAISPTAPPAASSPPGPTGPAEPNDPTETPPTSVDLITTAVAEGRLDFPTSLVYRAQALFGDPALPEEYASDVIPPDGEEDLGLFTIPAAMGDALPAEVQQNLEPYLVTPIDPRSAFYLGDNAAPVALVGGMAQVTDPACGDTGWTSKSSTVLRIKVWIKCTGNYSADMAQTLAVAEAEWKPMIALMGEPMSDDGSPNNGGDSSLDVYITDETVCPTAAPPCRAISKNSILGWARPTATAGAGPGEPSPGFLVMRRSSLSSDPALYRSTLIHEFFHILEFSHNTAAITQPTNLRDVNGDVVWDNLWFAEAAAKWSEWHFNALAGRQAEADRVHWWFLNLFQKVDRPLDSLEPNLLRYAAYAWPMFMAQEEGPEAVAAAWRALEPETTWPGVMDAIAGEMSFAEHFREFAIQNFNLNINPDGDDPRPKTWQDIYPTFPEGRPDGLKWRPATIAETEGEPVVITENLAHLSAHYYHVAFDDQATRIEVDASALNPLDAADLDVLLQIGDPGDNRWRHEKLGAETEWCDIRPEEDVTDMFLIVSNHDLAATVGGKIEIQATGVQCAGGSGTVTVTTEKHGTYTSARNNPVQLDVSTSATIDFDIVSDEFGSLAADSSKITWEYSLTSVETGDECVVREEGIGSGAWQGAGGPSLLLGWSAPDGYLFGMQLDEEKYALTVMPPEATMPDGDPSGWYKTGSSICAGAIEFSGSAPFTTLAVVDGDLPEDLASTYSGTRTRTLPALNDYDLPTTEVVTWSFTLQPEDIPPT